MTTKAPVAIFIYNRPDHLRKCLGALARCEGFAGSPIVVFGDGPRRPDQARSVELAREVATELLGAQARYEFSPTNKGLARSIIGGVGAMVEEFGRVIVLEDDLDLAPNFLTYMNTALDRYESDEGIYHVAGYAYDAPELVDRGRAAFMPFISSWGWATWRRAWRQMDESAAGWERLKVDAVLRRRFNLGGVYDFTTMIERQMGGKLDSWAIRWYWSVFRQNGLCLFPPATLVHNNGFDGSGSHGRGLLRRFGAARPGFRDGPVELPPPRLDLEAFTAVQRAISRQNGGGIGKAADMAKRLLWRLGLR